MLRYQQLFRALLFSNIPMLAWASGLSPIGAVTRLLSGFTLLILGIVVVLTLVGGTIWLAWCRGGEK
jgi:hypothetical protein